MYLDNSIDCTDNRACTAISHYRLDVIPVNTGTNLAFTLVRIEHHVFTLLVAIGGKDHDRS